MTAAELLRHFDHGTLRPSDLLLRVLDRVDQQDGELGAYVSLQRERALAEARAADEAWRAGTAGPLCGLPVSVKDILDVAGTVTGCGSAHPPGAPAEQDAEAVARLRRAGAVVLGKTQMHEYALGITGHNPRLGTPRHPLNPARLPGGSSSGAAVSVAAGMATAAIGTDTGGSIRVPAALCGLVGLKPTFGLVPTDGVFPLAHSMDHVGWLTRTVDDAALLLDALCAHRAGRAHPATRLALLREHLRAASPGVRVAVEAAAGRLEAAGVVVEEESVPMHDELARTYRVTQLFEVHGVHGQTFQEHPERYGEAMAEWLSQAAEVTAEQYARAQARRQAFSLAVDRLLERHDALLSPTTLITAPRRDSRHVQIAGRTLTRREALVCCTSPYSMIGLPAASVPAGSSEGLPVGLQIIGPRRGEQTVLQVARLVETTSPPAQSWLVSSSSRPRVSGSSQRIRPRAMIGNTAVPATAGPQPTCSAAWPTAMGDST